MHFNRIFCLSLLFIFLACFESNRNIKNKPGKDQVVLFEKLSSKLRKMRVINSFPFDNSGFQISKLGPVNEINIALPSNGKKRSGNIWSVSHDVSYDVMESTGGNKFNSIHYLIHGDVIDNFQNDIFTTRIRLQTKNLYNIQIKLTRLEKFSVKTPGTFEIINSEGAFKASEIENFTLHKEGLPVRNLESGKIVGFLNFSFPVFPGRAIKVGDQWEDKVIIKPLLNIATLEKSLNARLYTFEFAGFIKHKEKWLAYIEYFYQGYQISAKDLKSREPESSTYSSDDLKKFAATLTEMSTTSIKSHLEENNIANLFSFGFAQKATKGSGFILYDFSKNKVIELQEGSLSFKSDIMNSGSGNSFRYNIEKKQTLFLENGYQNSGPEEFNKCLKDMDSCEYFPD